MIVRYTRREALSAGAGALALAAFGTILPAHAANDSADLIKKFTGGKQATEGRVKLDLPEIAENGNTVPLTVSVESPMTSDDYVKAIHVFNEKNPQPHVFNARLSPANGRALVSTRIKLADAQQVVAIAETSKGEFWTAHADVIVTIAACIEDLT